MPYSMWGQQPPYYDFMGAPPEQGRQRKLSLEDLWSPTPTPQYPEPPQPIDSVGDLDEQRRRAIRLNALSQMGVAFGRGASDMGNLGGYIAQAGSQSMGFRDQQVAEAQAAQQQAYQRQRQQVDADFGRQQQDAKGRSEAERVMAMIDRIYEVEPGMGEQAEALAQSDPQALEKLVNDLPRRQAMRGQQIDPDDPFADDRMKAQIAQDAAVEQRKRMVDLGIYWEPEPSMEDEVERARAIAEAQAAARAKYRADDGNLSLEEEVRRAEAIAEAQARARARYREPEKERYQFIPDSDPWDGQDTAGWADPYNPAKPVTPVTRAPQRSPEQKLKDVEFELGSQIPPGPLRKAVMADLKAGIPPRKVREDLERDYPHLKKKRKK